MQVSYFTHSVNGIFLELQNFLIQDVHVLQWVIDWVDLKLLILIRSVLRNLNRSGTGTAGTATFCLSGTGSGYPVSAK
jgi:hypothetical protein